MRAGGRAPRRSSWHTATRFTLEVMTTSHVAIDPPGQGAPEQQQLPPASPERGGGGGGGGGARLWFRVACGAAAVGVACWLLRSFLLHNRHATDRLITRASIVGALAAVTYLLGIPKLLPR